MYFPSHAAEIIVIASPVLRNDLLKSLYIGMLQTLPLDTRAFWKQNPLMLDGKTLGESALLQHIWEDGAQSPLEYLNRVLESLEPFLLERGVSVEDFVDRISYWGNRGAFLHAQFLLKSLNPLVSRLFSSSDVMSFLLLFADLIGGRLVKGLSFPILKREVHDGKKQIYAMIRLPELVAQNLTPWDGHLYSARLLRVTPKVLGLPPYDSVDVLSDARWVEKVVWEGKPEIRDDVFFISGERMGTACRFLDFCSAHGFKMESYGLPSPLGVLMERDYHCPRRKRTVLCKGCFYGAPVYLIKIAYSLKSPRKGDYLFHLIEEATREALPSGAELERAHLDLVEAAKENIVCEYRSHEVSARVGGKELIRGTPAKILRRILRENRLSGKTEFTFREFKYDQELYHSSKNSGFEVSLKRLSEAMEKTGYDFALQRKGLGKFTLETRCKIEFRDSVGATTQVDSAN